MTREDFILKYGKNTKAKARFQRALREEVPGGAGVLDLLEHLNRLRNVAEGITPAERERLTEIEDMVQDIRTDMTDAIRDSYGF